MFEVVLITRGTNCVSQYNFDKYQTKNFRYSIHSAFKC